MQTYQIETSVSDTGIITFPVMPYLYNKKVKLIIIPTEENTTKFDQRKRAMERLLKKQEAMPVSHWSDEELDNLRYEYLVKKHR